MDSSLFKSAISTLMTEVCDDPQNPTRTWVVSNAPGSGLLGTIKNMSAERAAYIPKGVNRSIAAHVNHVEFALRTAIRCAQGDLSPANWDSSWELDQFDAAAWMALQDSVRESYRALLALETPEAAFENPEMVTGFCSAVAHTAYHLGAVRQLVLLTANR